MARRAVHVLSERGKTYRRAVKTVKTPAILVINKVDMVKKTEEVFAFIDAYQKFTILRQLFRFRRKTEKTQMNY